jgi:hypothetical protein
MPAPVSTPQHKLANHRYYALPASLVTHLECTVHCCARRDDGSRIVADARMPGYMRSTDPNDPVVNPCPPDWGNGQTVG